MGRRLRQGARRAVDIATSRRVAVIGGLLTLAFNLIVVDRLSAEMAPSLFIHEADAFAIDYIAFWAAGALANAGAAETAYDAAALLATQRDGMGFDYRHVMIWLYPPIALPFVQPFALLPPVSSHIAWAGVGALAYLAVCRRIYPSLTALVLAAAAGPVAANLFNGQTGLFIAALAGLFLLAAPRGGGGLWLALMAIKPHVALAIPLVSVACGRWRMLVLASAWLAALAAGVTLLYGPGVWAAFAGSLSGTADRFIVIGSVELIWAKYVSVYGLGRAAGFGLAPAALVQLAVAALCLVATVAAARSRDVDEWAAGALICYACCIVTPRVYVYDLPILAIGALFQARAAGADGLKIIERASFAIAFLAAEWAFLAWPQIGLVCAPVLFVACFMARARPGVVRAARARDRAG